MRQSSKPKGWRIETKDYNLNTEYTLLFTDRELKKRKKNKLANYNYLRVLSSPSSSHPQQYTFSSDSTWLYYSFMLEGDLLYLMVC